MTQQENGEQKIFQEQQGGFMKNAPHEKDNKQRKLFSKRNIILILVLFVIIFAGILFYLSYFTTNNKNSIQRGSIKDTIRNEVNALFSPPDLPTLAPDALSSMKKIASQIDNNSSSITIYANQKKGIITIPTDNYNILFSTYNIDTLDKDTLSKIKMMIDSDTPAIIFHFNFDEYNKLSDGEQALYNFKQIIEKNKKGINKIVLLGHTCDIGPDNYNIGLSENRVQFIANKLIDTGSGIIAIACGAYYPAVPNINSKNRAQNRRVEAIILLNNEH